MFPSIFCYNTDVYLISFSALRDLGWLHSINDDPNRSKRVLSLSDLFFQFSIVSVVKVKSEITKKYYQLFRTSHCLLLRRNNFIPFKQQLTHVDDDVNKTYFVVQHVGDLKIVQINVYIYHGITNWQASVLPSNLFTLRT